MLKRFWRSERLPTAALIIVSLVIGVLTLTHYGESWDELNFYKYAGHALASYKTWFQSAEIITTGNTYDNYGPAFVIFAAFVARILHALNAAWLVSDLRHLVYFATFLGGVCAFHALARRWMNAWAAFAATLLFITQPLLWGHAFISPKDIPFMAFFLISLALGLWMVDRTEPIVTGRPARAPLLWTGLWLASLLILFFASKPLDDGLAAVIRDASASPASLLAALLRGAASDFGEVPADVYVQKALVLLIRFKLVWLVVSTALLGWFYRKNYPSVYQLFNASTLLAGLALGLTTSTRILGPLAGLLVALYAFQKKGKAAIPLLAIYAMLGLFVMYFTWPYLWPDPTGRLLESLRVMSQYPWRGQVLFNGQYYRTNNLPITYLPILLAIQLTEPIWPLFFFGLGIAFWQVRQNRELLIACTLWFVLPLAALIATRAPLYDNFRQVFFILPPVFLVAGLGLDVLFKQLNRPVIRGLIAAALILPGLIAGVRLHPYEYIYYNRFIGGVHGAERRFELDYWGTSYREAANYLNRAAPANATIWVEGPAHLLGIYAREDLKIYSTYESERADHYDYVVATTRDDLDLKSYPQARVVYTVQRDGAVLTVIKQP